MMPVQWNLELRNSRRGEQPLPLANDVPSQLAEASSLLCRSWIYSLRGIHFTGGKTEALRGDGSICLLGGLYLVCLSAWG